MGRPWARDDIDRHTPRTPPDDPLQQPHPVTARRHAAGVVERGHEDPMIEALDCGSNSCRSPERGRGGMRTNGGCSCDLEDMAKAHERRAAALRGLPSYERQQRQLERSIAYVTSQRGSRARYRRAVLLSIVRWEERSLACSANASHWRSLVPSLQHRTASADALRRQADGSAASGHRLTRAAARARRILATLDAHGGG
jgi:hypothetical protein